MPRELIHLPAPAKLNLFLHVIGRQADQRHLLESVFVLIDRADTISLRLLDEDVVRRTGDVIGDVERDLCVRAARLLKSTYGIKAGVEIEVKKQIPAGAGMGGGSSDAATTLIGLNTLFDLKLNRQTLCELGLTLGADVPFFINGENAFVEGVGERFTPISIPPMRFGVIWPGRGIATSEIFSSPDLTRNRESCKISFFADSGLSSDKELFGLNDLEPVAKVIEPRVAEALELLAPCRSCRMTGSGSAVFGVLPAEEITDFRSLPEDWMAFEAKLLTRHPLADWLDD